MKIKTVKQLAQELCKREGKKRGVNVADMSETLAHLSDIALDSCNKFGLSSALETLVKNGYRRREAADKKKAKKK